MRARLGRVSLSGDDYRVLATARGLALPLTSSRGHAQLLYAFNAANASRQIGAEKTTVGCFVREAAHGAKTQINGSGGELTGLKMSAITQDHDSSMA
jgi:hypothetical protein